MRLDSIKTCKSCNKCKALGLGLNAKVECNSSDYTHKENFKEDGICAAAYCDGYKQGIGTRRFEMKSLELLNYIRGGNAEFTLHSTKTNQDFVFITQKLEKTLDDSQDESYFLKKIEDSKESYCGLLIRNKITAKYQFIKGKKGNSDTSDLDIRSLIHVLNRIVELNKENENSVMKKCEAVERTENKENKEIGLITYNNGICSKCGKALNDKDTLYGLCKSCR